MASTKKLTYYRRSTTKGSQGRRTGVRASNAGIRVRVDREHELVQLLTADAQFREAQMRVGTMALDPLAVWGDLEQFRDYTNLGPEHLPTWKNIGQYLKLHLLVRASLIFGGYAFTARVRPDLEAKWLREGKSASDRITKLISNGVSERKLGGLAFAYAMEGKGKRGYGRTGLHIHGVLQADDPIVATRFKVMLEETISTHPRGKVAAGFAPRSGAPVKVERLYDSGDPKSGTAGKWATYFTKNATRPEKRLHGKHVVISREATGLAREMWAFMRDEEV